MSSAMASAVRKSLRLAGTRLPEHREHAERERDVGGHRDAPARAPGAAER